MRRIGSGRLALTVGVVVTALLMTTGPTASAGSGSSPSTDGHGRPGEGGRELTVTSVSNPHPDLVSGGQVLLQVSTPSAGSGRLTVTLNGRSVTPAFQELDDGSLLGLVSGLRAGANRVEARQGRSSARMTVTNHPITGPVFSGPQQTPFYCETQAFGLPAASQPLCSAPTQISYRYRNTAGAFVVLADPTTRPADLATATVGGAQVPYIVRVETGTIDRAVYQVAALYDGTDPTPYRAETGWNRKLVYTFGGGCNGGYHQGAGTGGVLQDLFLGQGYAVASSSLNVLDNNCSPIISAEVAMMVKEHVVETYGPVLHTIGWGGSGGAIQQYDIADSYPGILDGIVPGVSFPDPFTTLNPVTDCRLLNAFFASEGASYSVAARTAIAGFNVYNTCLSWEATFANRSTATGSCNPAIPVDARWNPDTNPDGIRCSAAEQFATQLGRDPQTGFVRGTLDNVGVQYGLSALRSGQITPAEFALVNASIGGQDHTGALKATRSAADRRALAAAYRYNVLTSGGLGLKTTPIIDQRTDLDFAGFGSDIHTSEWSYVMRARLKAANGSAANQVIITTAPTPDQVGAASAYQLAAMDQWLTHIAADTSRRSPQHKVIVNKPAGLADGCYLSATNRIVEPATYPSSGQCGAVYPVAANTRLVAGEPLTQAVLKCRLQPLDFRDYLPVTFTDEQKAQLRAAFPTGVCDYRKDGVGQTRPLGSWLDYTPRRER